jgi:hypothetical protein
MIQNIVYEVYDEWQRGHWDKSENIAKLHTQ